jgi:hypothetical protein
MLAQLPNAGPLSAAQLVGRTFRFYGSHFGTFLLVTLVFWGPAFLLEILGAARPLLMVAGFWATWFGPLTIVSAVACLQQGGPVSLRACLAAGARRFWSYFGASFLQGWAFVGVLLPAIVLFAIATNSAGTTRFLAGFASAAAGAVAVVYLVVRWMVLLPALVLEDQGATAALGHSWDLTRGRFWHCAGFGILLNLPLVVVSLVLVSVVFMTAIVLAIAGSSDTGPLALVVLPVAVIGGAILYLWQPVQVLGTVLLFEDLRVRDEGCLPVPAIAQPAEQQAPADQQELAESAPAIITVAPADGDGAAIDKVSRELTP